MYKLDEVGEVDGNYHVTFFNPDEHTDINVSTIDYDMPLDRFFKFWKTSNQ